MDVRGSPLTDGTSLSTGVCVHLSSLEFTKLRFRRGCPKFACGGDNNDLSHLAWLSTIGGLSLRVTYCKPPRQGKPSSPHRLQEKRQSVAVMVPWSREVVFSACTVIAANVLRMDLGNSCRFLVVAHDRPGDFLPNMQLTPDTVQKYLAHKRQILEKY